LWFGLEYLADIGIRNIDAFGDSMLVVQQVRGESQCLDGVLNSYLDKCLDIVKTLDTFGIYLVPRGKKIRKPIY
jgi:ribonuclease HI